MNLTRIALATVAALVAYFIVGGIFFTIPAFQAEFAKYPAVYRTGDAINSVMAIGMLGYMFWAAERPSSRGIGTVPPNSCENGVGAGATALGAPIPMPALRAR